MPTPRPKPNSLAPTRRGRRSGFSLLEVQVAFVLLGIAMSGVGPIVVMQLRLSKKLEQGFNRQTAYFRPVTTFYLVPQADPWERKLGIAASLSSTAPGSSLPPGSGATPGYTVTITAPVEKSLGSEEVTVHVKIVKVSK